MGCGCGGSTPPEGIGTRGGQRPDKEENGAASQHFRLELPSGEALLYGSRLEAEAARVRLGSRGTVTRF